MGLYDDDPELDFKTNVPKESGFLPGRLGIAEKEKDASPIQTQVETSIIREPVKYDLTSHANLIPTRKKVRP